MVIVHYTAYYSLRMAVSPISYTISVAFSCASSSIEYDFFLLAYHYFIQPSRRLQSINLALVLSLSSAACLNAPICTTDCSRHQATRAGRESRQTDLSLECLKGHAGPACAISAPVVGRSTAASLTSLAPAMLR